MITADDIKSYLKAIPPLPDTLEQSLELIEQGDLPAAAKVAGQDAALHAYFQDIISKPIFGFQGKVENIVQIFGALGIIKVKQILESYMLQLIKPEEWSFFAFDNAKFRHMQAECIAEWEKIYDALQCDDEDINHTIALLPATVIVCEKLFSDHKIDIRILQDTKNLDLNSILLRLTGMGFFHIAVTIGKRWKLPERSLKYLMLSSGDSYFKNIDPKNLKRAQVLHLFFFMILSRSPYMEAGMNGFIEFKPDFVAPVMEEFMQVSGMQA